MAVFSDDVKKKIDHYLQRYETKRSAILPVLHVIQDSYGWVQDQHIEALEVDYGLSKVDVLEVFTFYTAYLKEKPAKYHIQFCDNIVCEMRGAKEAMHCIEEKYVAKDKTKFDCIGVPCLGLCGQAPVMLVNKDRYGNVTADKVDGILSSYSPKE